MRRGLGFESVEKMKASRPAGIGNESTVVSPTKIKSSGDIEGYG